MRRRLVREALTRAEPPPRKTPVRRSPQPEPVREIIEGWLRADLDAPRKQRHSIKPILAAPASEEEAAVAELSGIGRYIELPGTGHLTPVTDPAAVIGPVLEFFRRTNMRN